MKREEKNSATIGNISTVKYGSFERCMGLIRNELRRRKRRAEKEKRKREILESF